MHARATAVPVGISLCPSSSSRKHFSQLSQAKDYVSGALGLKPGASNAPVHSHTSVTPGFGSVLHLFLLGCALI